MNKLTRQSSDFAKSNFVDFFIRELLPCFNQEEKTRVFGSGILPSGLRPSLRSPLNCSRQFGPLNNLHSRKVSNYLIDFASKPSLVIAAIIIFQGGFDAYY